MHRRRTVCSNIHDGVTQKRKAEDGESGKRKRESRSLRATSHAALESYLHSLYSRRVLRSPLSAFRFGLSQVGHHGRRFDPCIPGNFVIGEDDQIRHVGSRHLFSAPRGSAGSPARSARGWRRTSFSVSMAIIRQAVSTACGDMRYEQAAISYARNRPESGPPAPVRASPHRAVLARRGYLVHNVRASRARTNSVNRIGSLLRGAKSPRVSRIALSCRIGTCSRQQNLKDLLHVRKFHRAGDQLRPRPLAKSFLSSSSRCFVASRVIGFRRRACGSSPSNGSPRRPTGSTHRVAEHFRLLAQARLNPQGRRAEGRILGRYAGNLAGRHPASPWPRASSVCTDPTETGWVGDLDPVLLLIEAEVVANANFRRE